MDTVSAFILFIGWPLSMMIAYNSGFRDGIKAHQRIANVRIISGIRSIYEILCRAKKRNRQPMAICKTEFVQRTTTDYARVR